MAHLGMAKKLKRPRDSVQLAKLIGDIATGQVNDTPPQKVRPPVDDLATVDGDERILLVTRRLKETRAARRKRSSQERRSTKGS
jgi:hypothetical protein